MLYCKRSWIDVKARTNPDPWRPTAHNAVGMALVRAVSAPRAAGLRRRRHPLGRGRIERPAQAARPLQLVRQKGRDDLAFRLGGNDVGFLPFPVWL
jgi:hypothetical protein